MTPPISSRLALTDQLCEMALVLALRHFSPVLNSHADVPQCIAAYLNANLRCVLPAISRAALMRLTWIDLDIAFRLGDVWLLDKMRAMHPLIRPLQYSRTLLEVAAQAGHVHVLEWWRKTLAAGPQGQPIIYAGKDRIMDVASEYGHVHILKWCVKQEQVQEFQYSAHAMDKASANGFVEVLEWWLEEHRQMGRELKYTAAAVDSASAAGHLPVLQWWKDQSVALPFKFSPNKAFPQTVSKELLPVFVWWKYSGYAVIRNLSKITESAVRANRLALLKWLKDNGYLQVDPQHVFIACAVAGVKLSLVEFLWQHLSEESKSDFNASPAFVAASRAGRVDLLNYFASLGLAWAEDTAGHATTSTAEDTVVLATTSTADAQVLEWWFEREPDWSTQAIHMILSDASARGDVPVLKWMSEAGLLKGALAKDPQLWQDILSRLLDDAFVSRNLDAAEWWESFLSSAALDVDPASESAVTQDDIQGKFSKLLNVAIAMNWTDYVVLAHKKGHALKLDSSCVVASHKGIDAFDQCLELYHDGLVAGPSTDWKELGISDAVEWAKVGVEVACGTGNLQALDFYSRCNLLVSEGGYSGLKEASALGHIHVLQWWLEQGLPLASTDATCNDVCLNPFACDFWTRHKDHMPFTVAPPNITRSFMALAAETKHIPSLAALSNALRLKLVSMPGTAFALDLSSAGLASYLEWWFAHCGRPAEVWSQASRESLLSATTYQWISVLDWWKHSGIQLKVPYRHIRQVRGLSKSVAWWTASGLVEVS